MQTSKASLLETDYMIDTASVKDVLFVLTEKQATAQKWGQYEIECLICNVTYIGETGRNAGVRINEDMAGKRRRSLITPLGRHRNEAHNGNDYDVKCVILAHETEISARKMLEAF
ncbi:hypothetical protein RB195_015805 [Necator americanus]|uniref:Uncharacterized protein n=1 Tax=Necator americanus TaxID=51031 RepID=A0ABR1E696_NECAM